MPPPGESDTRGKAYSNYILYICDKHICTLLCYIADLNGTNMICFIGILEPRLKKV